MKKMIFLLLCCLLLTGCSVKQPEATSPAVTTEPVHLTPETAPAEHYLTLYAPNADATGFTYTSWEIPELSASAVCNALIEAGVLNEDVAFNSITADGKELKLDVNEAFHRQLCSYGTAGEYMMVGSVVNTLLGSTYDSVFITCEGNIMESGHVIYDFPLEFHEDY